MGISEEILETTFDVKMRIIELALDRAQAEEVTVGGPDVGAFLGKTIAEAEKLLETFEDDGDWYGCLTHAVGYLKEAARSMPPRGTSVPGY